jgi:5-methylcytosine-specific restriction endonuclease McrA
VCANPDCSKPFLKVWGAKQRCCSERCGKRRWALQAKGEGRTYREPWSDRRRDAYHRRRALKKATSTGAPVIRDQIGDRDRWKCGICGARVNRDLTYPHPMSPSLDHMVPLSKGGPHSPENVQISHLRCNTAKGDRGGCEQLMLIG